MHPYFIAAISVTSIALILYASKYTIKVWQLIIIFLLIAGFAFLSRGEASVYDMPCRLSAQWEIEAYGYGNGAPPKKLTDKDRQQFAEKATFHKKEGDRTWQAAQDICWWFPTKSDRERALDCFKVAATGAVPQKPRAKMVTMVVALLTQMGADCFNAWNDMNNKLYWSEYHYTMYEFYLTLSNAEHI